MIPAEKTDLQSILTLTEFESLAQTCMSAMTLGYEMDGAGDELICTRWPTREPQE